MAPYIDSLERPDDPGDDPESESERDSHRSDAPEVAILGYEDRTAAKIGVLAESSRPAPGIRHRVRPVTPMSARGPGGGGRALERSDVGPCLQANLREGGRIFAVA
jgi:hypothetical protein